MDWNSILISLVVYSCSVQTFSFFFVLALFVQFLFCIWWIINQSFFFFANRSPTDLSIFGFWNTRLCVMGCGEGLGFWYSKSISIKPFTKASLKFDVERIKIHWSTASIHPIETPQINLKINQEIENPSKNYNFKSDQRNSHLLKHKFVEFPQFCAT
jgi:hypothetical protein